MPPASCYLLPASCFLLSASNSPLPALCTQRPVLHSCIELSASSFLLSAPCFRLPASCALCLYSLLSAPSALSHLLSASCLLIGTLRKMVFREVVSMGSEPQLFHTPKKRVRSATSRRTPTLSVCYQLAFFTPGIRPFEAISRNWIRLMPN